MAQNVKSIRVEAKRVGAWNPQRSKQAMITFTIREREANLPVLKEACESWGAKLTTEPTHSEGVLAVTIECASVRAAFYIGNSAGYKEAMRK